MIRRRPPYGNRKRYCKNTVRTWRQGLILFVEIDGCGCGDGGRKARRARGRGRVGGVPGCLSGVVVGPKRYAIFRVQLLPAWAEQNK